jgi:serine/threonine protein kinase
VCLDPWCLVMEFVKYGDLYSFLHNENNIISWKMKLKIAQNIAEAIRFLHSFQPKIIHRDLKSPNCLVDLLFIFSQNQKKKIRY